MLTATASDGTRSQVFSFEFLLQSPALSTHLTHVMEKCPKLVVVLFTGSHDDRSRSVVALVDDHDVAGGDGTRAVDATVGRLHHFRQLFVPSRDGRGFVVKGRSSSRRSSDSAPLGAEVDVEDHFLFVTREGRRERTTAKSEASVHQNRKTNRSTLPFSLCRSLSPSTRIQLFRRERECETSCNQRPFLSSSSTRRRKQESQRKKVRSVDEWCIEFTAAQFCFRSSLLECSSSILSLAARAICLT